MYNLNNMCRDTYDVLIAFLETQDYMLFLRTTKHIYQNIHHTINNRKPYVIAYNDNYGEFGISKECSKLRYEIHSSNRYVLNTHYCHRSGALIHAILQLGAEKSSTYSNIKLFVVPWKFRKNIKYNGHNPFIDFSGYLKNLIIKYKKKVDNVAAAEKKNMQSFYFEKLVREQENVSRYNDFDYIYAKIYADKLNYQIKYRY